MNATLLVMAAGLGSRFGGVKQLAKVGRNGEAFIDLSIQDAEAAGFSDVVVIVRSEIESDVAEHLGQYDHKLPIRLVRQDDFGPARTKPWGTMHAVVSAQDALDQPFCVINADDFYGPKSFVLAIEQLRQVNAHQAAMVAFELGKTLPPTGSVSRGVCSVGGGALVKVIEAEVCERHADGSITADGERVDSATPVSMNMWGFHHRSVPAFFDRWEVFLAANENQDKAECQLPTVVSELMAADAMSVAVASSPEEWIGITNPEDFERARQALH